jgi:hypothetical protein
VLADFGVALTAVRARLPAFCGRRRAAEPGLLRCARNDGVGYAPAVAEVFLVLFFQKKNFFLTEAFT